MKTIRQIAASAALVLGSVSPLLAQASLLQNGTFDSNSLAGWQVFGDVLAADGQVSLTNAVADGNPDSLNQTGTWSVDIGAEGGLAGLPVTSFDIGGPAYEGSAIAQRLSGAVGSVFQVSFDWAFASTDAMFPDFGFVALNDKVHSFVDATGQIVDAVFLRTVVDAQNVSWNWFQSSYSAEAAADGSLALSLGVVDVGDYEGDSRLLLDNVRVSPNDVPEPGSVALMLAGLGVLGGVLRRRQRAQQG